MFENNLTLLLCFHASAAFSKIHFALFSLFRFHTGFWLEEIFWISLVLVLTPSRFWIKALRDYCVHRWISTSIVCSSF